MTLALRPASDDDRAYCEALSRSNMAAYRSTREIEWDPERFLASWSQFENLIITANDVAVGTLRLLAIDEALEIRDLQVLPAHHGHGIGTWAIREAMMRAAERGFRELRLRVFPENPAHRLYRRIGFVDVANKDDVVHMQLRLR